MVFRCFVNNCKNATHVGKNKIAEKTVTWHKLPSDPALQEKWARALNVQTLLKSRRICSKHFSSDCFEKNGFRGRRLKPDSVPSLFLQPDEDGDNMQNIPPENDAVMEERKEMLASEGLIHKTSLSFGFSSSLLPSTKSNVEPQPAPDNDFQMREESTIIMPETPKKSTMKKFRYPGDISEENVLKMSPRTIVKSMKMLQKVCTDKGNRIRKLMRTQRNQKKKIESLQQLLTALRKSNLISANAHDVLETMAPDNTDITKDIQRGKVNGKYPPHLRSFALTLNFYSPRAYEYVRKVYQTKLPAPSTIRNWYSSTNGSPGITDEAISILKRKADALPDKRLFACLMADEMAIRRQAEWNHSQKRFLGYVDFGTMIPEPDQLPLAKEALVYLSNGINERWKIPVAYFFINGLTALEKADITRKVLVALATAGIFIIAFTFDGLPANIAMCTELSADVYNDRPYFKHPTMDLVIRIIFDAAHMHKLIRNLYASREVLYDGDNNAIRWQYIVALVNIQQASFCHLANKLNRKHLDWKRNKMNVKLAVQTLSESVAVALEQLLEDGHKDFVGCAATIKFIRMVNNSFDCLNSRSLFSNKYKRPIMQSSAAELFSFFEEAKSYFRQLKFEIHGRPIIEGRLKTGLLGFIIDMQNLQDIYFDFVTNGQMKYILAYKFSQDHLETFFSCIRSMGGFNNNPNTAQFTAAYKRLLHRNEVKSSAEANCIPLDDTNILTISSRRNNIEEKPIEQDVDPLVIDDLPLQYIDPVSSHCTVYVAGFVERKVFKTIQCETCIKLLGQCEPMKSTFINNKSFGFLHYPSLDTHRIVSTVEKIINLYRIDNSITHKNIYNKIFLNSVRNINMDLVFTNFDDHIKELGVGENHKYYLIKLIIDYYVKVKISFYGKELTRREHSNYLRSVLNKTILFTGQ